MKYVEVFRCRYRMIYFMYEWREREGGEGWEGEREQLMFRKHVMEREKEKDGEMGGKREMNVDLNTFTNIKRIISCISLSENVMLLSQSRLRPSLLSTSPYTTF